jgi:ribonuclease P protein component
VKRKFRLRNTSDFKRVRRMGKSYAHPLIVLQSALNGLDYSRAGVLAGRSIGNAVRRNREKRRMREAIRPLLNQIAPGYDLLFIARRALNDAATHELQAAVMALLQKAGTLETNSQRPDTHQDVE